PLEGGLAAVAEEFPWGRMRSALRRIVRKLETGADLESVLASSGAPRYLPSLVRAGRRSGRTAAILENFIASSRALSDLRQTLLMALAYPMVLLLLCVPLGAFLIFWLIPQFAAIFDGFEIRLPWITTVVIVASRFLADHGVQTLGALA